MNIARLTLEGRFDPEYLRWCYTSSKTGQQKQAEAGQSIDARRAGGDLDQQKALTGTAQGTLGQFEGPVQDSPFYKALLTTGIESTSNNYDTAKANANARANQAGFGYTQPIAQGANNQIAAREASDLAAVPRQALQATAPLALDAAKTTGSMGMQYGDQALGWDKGSQGWNDQAANQQNKRKGWLENYNNFTNTFGPGIQAALAAV